MNWEQIEEFIYRTRTPMGWIVKYETDVMTSMNTGYVQPELTKGYEWRTSITFVFDPFHAWKIKKED